MPFRPRAVVSGVAFGGKNKMEPPKDVTPPEGFEVVLHKDALETGEVTEIIIAGKAIAVCNVGGEFFAITNSCPLAGCPLSEGSLDGHVITCPYHGWSYDVRSGLGITYPDSKIQKYEACVKEDAVCVKV